MHEDSRLRTHNIVGGIRHAMGTPHVEYLSAIDAGNGVDVAARIRALIKEPDPQAKFLMGSYVHAHLTVTKE